MSMKDWAGSCHEAAGQPRWMAGEASETHLAEPYEQEIDFGVEFQGQPRLQVQSIGGDQQESCSC